MASSRIAAEVPSGRDVASPIPGAAPRPRGGMEAHRVTLSRGPANHEEFRPPGAVRLALSRSFRPLARLRGDGRAALLRRTRRRASRCSRSSSTTRTPSTGSPRRVESIEDRASSSARGAARRGASPSSSARRPRRPRAAAALQGRSHDERAGRGRRSARLQEASSSSSPTGGDRQAVRQRAPTIEVTLPSPDAPAPRRRGADRGAGHRRRRWLKQARRRRGSRLPPRSLDSEKRRRPPPGGALYLWLQPCIDRYLPHDGFQTLCCS